VRLVFFSHYFPPEVNAPANRTHEHCREWVKAGHEVHVVTCVPSHPFGEPFPGYRRRWYQHEEVDGIHVHRVWTYLAPNKGVIRRTLNYLSFIPSAAWRAWKLGRFDVALSTSPQFFCAVGAWLYSRVRPVPWIFELRDLWPESIPAVGAMRKSLPLRLIERLELRMYRDADAIVAVTQAFIETLASRGVPPAKMHFIPNGIDPSFWETGDRAAARASLGLGEDAVLACYIGTIGMAHGLGTVLDAAEALRSRSASVQFLIVGDGAELDRLKEQVELRRLTNVRMLGLVPRDRVPSLLAAADIALVTLKPAPVFKTVLPSKMFEAMAARRPILLGVDGEARAVLERAGAGIPFSPGDAGALAAAIEELARDPAARVRMGTSGGAFVQREFSRAVWAERYLDVLAPLAGGGVTSGVASAALESRVR
jgi:glycosyltransferase involved in cell wall biosynthesis